MRGLEFAQADQPHFAPQTRLLHTTKRRSLIQARGAVGVMKYVTGLQTRTDVSGGLLIARPDAITQTVAGVIDHSDAVFLVLKTDNRSEERRVGKDCRSPVPA